MSKRMSKRKPEKPLTEQQKKAVQLLYNDEPVNEVAAALGVHRTTVWRWKQTRAFKREWNRIDYNMRRKFERREMKRRIQEDEYWEAKLAEAKAKLDEESAKVKNKPGKSWYKAWNEYEKAMCRGRNLAELFDLLYSQRRKRRQ